MQYLGDQHWHQCWFFRFFFLFLCPPVHVLVSLCVCVPFCNNLKFSKAHNYWFVQLVYVNLNSGLELKKCKLCIKMFRNFSKKSGEGGISVRLWVKAASSATVSNCLFFGPVWSMVILWNACFLSAKSFLCFPVWLWTTALKFC